MQADPAAVRGDDCGRAVEGVVARPSWVVLVIDPSSDDVGKRAEVELAGCGRTASASAQLTARTKSVAIDATHATGFP